MGKPIPLPFYPLLSKTSRSKIHFTGAFPHNPRMSRERCIVQYPVFFVSACFVSAFSVLAFQRTLRYYTRLSSRKNDSGFSSYSGTGFPVRTQCSPTAIAVRSTELSPRQFFFARSSRSPGIHHAGKPDREVRRINRLSRSTAAYKPRL